MTRHAVLFGAAASLPGPGGPPPSDGGNVCFVTHNGKLKKKSAQIVSRATSAERPCISAEIARACAPGPALRAPAVRTRRPARHKAAGSAQGASTCACPSTARAGCGGAKSRRPEAANVVAAQCEPPRPAHAARARHVLQRQRRRQRGAWQPIQKRDKVEALRGRGVAQGRAHARESCHDGRAAAAPQAARRRPHRRPAGSAARNKRQQAAERAQLPAALLTHQAASSARSSKLCVQWLWPTTTPRAGRR